MATTTKITKRIDPCNCGCQGSDPWHQKEYERVLHDVREERGAVKTAAYGHSADPQKYVRTATVHAPWSKNPVRVVELILEFDGREASLGWFFVNGAVES